jgi:hypothetical protein
MNRNHALLLLCECTGDDIWSVEYCLQRSVPEAWVRKLQDAYESGFDCLDSQIFFRGQVVNQFEGVRDVDLACMIAQWLKLDVQRIVQHYSTRAGVVRAIREELEEG